jgi:hypothetical protein
MQRNMYPIELFILNSEKLLVQSKDGVIIGNVFVRLQPPTTPLAPVYTVDNLQIFMECLMKLTAIKQFIIGKIDDSNIYIMLIVESIEQAQQILTDIEALISEQQPKYDHKITYVHAFYEHQLNTDFFEIYTNTVGKIFI